MKKKTFSFFENSKFTKKEPNGIEFKILIDSLKVQIEGEKKKKNPNVQVFFFFFYFGNVSLLNFSKRSSYSF